MQMHANLLASKGILQSEIELMWLQTSPLINLFGDIANRNAGTDGWSVWLMLEDWRIKRS